MSFVGRIEIPASHGQLEGIYRPSRGDAEKVALLLHPHPQHGGTMHNKVIFRSAKALEEIGFETLRFNYRGVGNSTGTYDDGLGETDDAEAALSYLRKHQPHATHVLVLGFSFGAGIAFALAKRASSINRVISVGTPDYALDKATPEALAKAAFIHGEDDTVAPLAAIRTGLAAARSIAPLSVVSHADHFFTGRLTELQEAVENAASSDQRG